MLKNSSIPVAARLVAAALVLAMVIAKGFAKTSVFTTENGITFAILGDKPAQPVPTYLIFVANWQAGLDEDIFLPRESAASAPVHYLCVSLDLPAEGRNQRRDEPPGLRGWRRRFDQGEDFVTPFVKRVSAVLDYLIRERFTDPQRIGLVGESRGGFLAVHVAAADPRIHAVALFSPLIEPTALSELRGLEGNAVLQTLSLASVAGRVAGRPIWICIGNDDRRVGTDLAISFSRRLVAINRAQGKPAAVELHVMEAENHHKPAAAFSLSAAWLARQWAGTGDR